MEKHVECVFPARTSAQAVRSFLCEHERWIGKHVQVIKERSEAVAAQPFLWNGSPVSIVQGTKPAWSEGKLVVSSPEATHRFLIREAKKVIESELDEVALIMGVFPARVSVKEMRTKWGSCSNKGNVSFCWRLAMAPPEVRRSIIIHELAHLKHLNHSPAFWGLVESHDAKYKRHHDWLKKNGWKLMRSSPIQMSLS